MIGVGAPASAPAQRVANPAIRQANRHPPGTRVAAAQQARQRGAVGLGEAQHPGLQVLGERGFKLQGSEVCLVAHAGHDLEQLTRWCQHPALCVEHAEQAIVVQHVQHSLPRLSVSQQGTPRLAAEQPPADPCRGACQVTQHTERQPCHISALGSIEVQRFQCPVQAYLQRAYPRGLGQLQRYTPRQPQPLQVCLAGTAQQGLRSAAIQAGENTA